MERKEGGKLSKQSLGLPFIAVEDLPAKGPANHRGESRGTALTPSLPLCIYDPRSRNMKIGRLALDF
jgi:hypothetical protein